jgi:MFS family permease|tara:strand:- start:9622 stop:10845 length:1224 start_codon:yes stop_codon:yes gene_type:complete
MSKTITPLYFKGYLYLWIGMVAVGIATMMQMTARGYLAYELTNSASKLTYVNVAFAFPMLSLSLFGGALSDRLDKQKIIQTGQFAAAFLAFVISALIFSDHINWLHLLTVSFIQGGIWAFMVPSRHSFIADLVPDKNLNSAIALNSAGFNVSNLIAPAVAGLIYGLSGPAVVYSIIGGLALMGVFFTFIIKPEMRIIDEIPNTNKSEKKEIFAEIKIGLTYIYNEKLLFSLLIASLIFSLLAEPFRFLLPIFVKDIYLKGPEAMGLLTTLMGLGSVIASVIIAGIDANKRGLIWIIGGFITAGSLLTLAISDSYVISMVVMIFMGASDSIRRTLSMSIMMEKTRPDLRGRIMSIYMLNWGLIPLGALPAGIVADIIGAQSTIGILSILLVISSVVVLITQKELRNVN